MLIETMSLSKKIGRAPPRIAQACIFPPRSAVNVLHAGNKPVNKSTAYKASPDSSKLCSCPVRRKSNVKLGQRYFLRNKPVKLHHLIERAWVYNSVMLLVPKDFKLGPTEYSKG